MFVGCVEFLVIICDGGLCIGGGGKIFIGLFFVEMIIDGELKLFGWIVRDNLGFVDGDVVLVLLLWWGLELWEVLWEVLLLRFGLDGFFGEICNDIGFGDRVFDDDGGLGFVKFVMFFVKLFVFECWCLCLLFFGWVMLYLFLRCFRFWFWIFFFGVVGYLFVVIFWNFELLKFLRFVVLSMWLMVFSFFVILFWFVLGWWGLFDLFLLICLGFEWLMLSLVCVLNLLWWCE